MEDEQVATRNRVGAFRLGGLESEHITPSEEKEFGALRALVKAQSEYLNAAALESVSTTHPFMLIKQKWGLLQYMIEHRFQVRRTTPESRP